jgi:hypothetical protein
MTTLRESLLAGALVTWVVLDQRRNAGSLLRNRATRRPADASRLTYRAVGARGELYPEWLRALRGKPGVYVIRDRHSAEILYVGSATRLYETITRHLQTWRRWKRWWDGGYADNSGHDPGVTYDRSEVEVAARSLPASQAGDEEKRLICALKPRDNVNLTDCDEDIPF